MATVWSAVGAVGGSAADGGHGPPEGEPIPADRPPPRPRPAEPDQSPDHTKRAFSCPAATSGVGSPSLRRATGSSMRWRRGGMPVSGCGGTVPDYAGPPGDGAGRAGSRRNRVQHRPGPRAAARGRGVIPWPWRQPPPLRPHRHRAIGTPPTLGAVELRGRGSRFGAPRCGWSVRGHRAGAPRPGLGAGPRTGVGGARAWMRLAGSGSGQLKVCPRCTRQSASPSPPPASSPVTAFIVPTPPRGRRPGRGRVGSRPVRAGGHRGRRP